MAYAHTPNDNGEWHDLVDHLTGTAALAELFASAFGAGELGHWLGRWHDLGKFHPDFQDYLKRCRVNPRARGRGPDHKAAGAEVAMRHFNPLSLLIQGHHGGLRSPTEKDTWLSEKHRGGAIEEALALARAAMPDVEAATLNAPQHVVKDPLAAEMFLRLIFSALVDADFLDTEHHFKSGHAVSRGSAVSIADLWQLLGSSQKTLTARAGTSPVNEIRDAVFIHCVQAATGAGGFYRLTVPTGGGKTRAGMAFALRHALQHGLQRVIVAVPFISITEQTASVYRDIFGSEHDRAVLEHHSLAEWDEDNEGDFHGQPTWDRLAAENWDAPVIVTTTVQLFQSLFSNRTSRVRKLHRLARSVIVLDEAQALPARLLKPILDGLRQLVQHYGTSVVISTATQPAFESIPLFAEVGATEIVPEPVRFFDALRRVKYEWLTKTPLRAKDTAARLRGHRQALAVLNTKKDALAVLDEIDSSSRPTEAWTGSWEETFFPALRNAEALHLSTLLCGVHRLDVLSEIKRRLSHREHCLVVSTQVIEAGVDIDFPFVMRALAPLDAIIQAAGRCNREGKLSEPGRVVIFEPEGGALPQGEYRIGAQQTAALANRVLLEGRELDPHDLTTVQLYYSYFLSALGAAGLDRDHIQRSRQRFDFPQVARDFRMIDNDTYSLVITSYGNDSQRRRLRHAIGELRGGTPRARELRRQLQPYIVAVGLHQAEQLRRGGLIDEVRPGYGVWLGNYDAVRGLVQSDVNLEVLVV